MKQLIQFCTECMQEYLHNPQNALFVTTTTTPLQPTSTLGQPQPNHLEAVALAGRKH
jgi:hypothetical protein